MTVSCAGGRVVLERGKTTSFESLGPRSAALDGYVPGPHVDAGARRFSFDHHAGCLRHATLSTCEMALDAVRVGLDPSDLTLFINDLDPDTVLATWVLLRPVVAHNERVVRAVRALGRVDALGPAVGGVGLVSSLRWAMAPMFELESGLRQLSEAAWGDILEVCLARLDHWVARGARATDPELTPARPPPAGPVGLLHHGAAWVLASGMAARVFGRLYRAGHRAVIAHHALADGTHEYTVGKASEFVAGFDVPRILAALRDAERRANPDQADAFSWGGGSTIGGSPRNADGSASRLDWPDVVAVVEAVAR